MAPRSSQAKPPARRRHTNGMVVEDRRSHPRRPVDLLLNKYVQGRPYVCRATDISPAGMQLQAIQEPQSEVTHVSVQFELPGREAVINCTGRLVPREDGQTGLEFVQISPKNQQILESYLEEWDESAP